MNEQAIQDAYTLFQKSGYKKDINQFKQLIATNPNALNDAYNLFKGSGYKKDINSFSDLMGLKKKESSQLTSQPKQQVSKSQQQKQPTSLATGQQQPQQASATSNGVTKDEGNWFDKSMSYVTGIASESVKSVFQKADDALNASKNYLKSEGFFDDGKVPDSPKSITDYFLNAADKYKDLGTKEVVSQILPIKEAEIAMKIINSSMPQEQKNNVLKTINLASTKIKAGIGHIEEYQKYVLPEHNIPTNVLLGMASIAPDLIAAEVMGPASAESKLAAWGEKATENASTLVKKYAPKALKFVEEAATGNFTKIMAAEGAAKAAANTKEGENLYVNTLKGGIEGELEGMYMHGLGVASGKVMPSIAKGIARSGVNSEIATAIANPLANAGVFATAKALRTGIEEKRLLTAEELGTELGTGIGFSLLHAGSLYKNHNELNHYYDNVLNNDNLGSFSRVINETKDNLKAAYNPKLTDADVKELTDARDELKAAILKEPDLNNKQILGDQAVKIQNQLDAHSAINGIVKDKDAIVKLIESNNEIPEEDRTRYVAKINAIADTFDMSEMAVKKREFDSKMEAAQSELDKANQEFNAAVKPSEKIAAKVKVDNARKTLDDLNTELTTFIKEAPVAGTPDQISKPIELSVEPKPTELKSPIELKEGEELIDVKEDGKGKTYTYTAKSTEKDGVKTTKFEFNRSDKDPSQRNATGVDADKVLDKYNYEINSDDIPEGAKVFQINEIREGKDSTAATVTFEIDGNRFKNEVLLKPKEAKAEVKTADLVKEYIDNIEKVKAESPDVFWSVDRPFQNEDGTINEVELKKAAEEGRLIKTEAGFGVVGKDGDIKGVFKADLKSTEKTGDKVIQEAVKAGGTKLDNFALPNLMKIYERNGFREVSRLPFNEEYAPEGWSKEKHGTPDVVAMVYDPEGKLPIEKKNFTDYDEAIKYRDSFLEEKPETDADLEALHKLFDESEQGGKFSDEQVENGKKAIEGIVPDVEWVIHETNESMKSATGTTNKGEYILTRDKDGNVKREIHINKAKADGTTVAHEVFHAVLLEKVLNDADAQDLTRRMMKAVAKTASPKIKQELENFVKTYPEYLKDEERLAQLVGILAKNYDQLSKPNKTIIKKWLDKIAKMFGLKPFTDNEVIDLLNTIAGKTAKGEAITEKDVEIFKGGKKVQNVVSRKQAVTLMKGTEDLVKYGLNQGKNITRKVGEALEKRQREKYGYIEQNDRSESAKSKISNWMVDEVKYFIETMGDKSGKGWYGEKYQKALDNMSKVFPEMKSDKNARDLFTMLVAITSDGQKVLSNFKLASFAYDYYKKNGVMPSTLPGQRTASFESNLSKINKLLLDYKGDIASIKKDLMEIKSIEELNKERKKEGLDALQTSWPVSFKAPFAASIFGPKLGMFYSNLSGNESYPTLDRWWSRTFNRYRGTLIPEIKGGITNKGERQGIDRFKELLGDVNMSDEEAILASKTYRDSYAKKGYKNGSEVEKAANTIYKIAYENLNDAPFNKTDRQFMYDSVTKALSKLNKEGYDLSVADVQAILWYFEKNLYKKLGVQANIEGISYEEAANTTFEKWKENNKSFNYNIKESEDDAGVEGADTDIVKQSKEETVTKRSQKSGEDIKFEAKNNSEYVVKDKGEVVGRLKLTNNRDLGKGYLEVDTSELLDKYIGKGIGSDLYRTAAKNLNDKNIVITSSKFRSEKAESMWKKLEKAGEAVKIYSDNKLKRSVYALVNPNEVRRSQKTEWEESKLGRGDKAIIDRDPILQNAAERYANNEISYEEYLKIKDVTSPIKPITDFIEPAKEEDIKVAVGSKSEGKTNLDFEKGKPVGLRLDIPAYINKNIWAITVHEPNKGAAISYNNVARIENVTFESNPKVALDIARKKINKGTIARMNGDWVPIEGKTSEEKGKNAMKFVDSIVDNPEWSQVGMNPFRHSWFYDRADGKPVLSADELIQIGGLVYAKNVVKTTPYDKAFEFIDKETGSIKRFQKDGEKLIDDYVRISRNNNFSDATIKKFLKSKGFSDADIDAALAPKEKSKNFVKSFFSEDVAPRFKSTAEAIHETSKAIVNALSPKTGVDKGVVTKFYELTGDRNKSNTFVDKIVGDYEKTFDKMSTVDRVEFVDRMKAGKAQATPELDVIAKVISKLDKDLYDEITKYSPNLAWKENHFRVLWKKIPGKEKEKFWSFLSKRPLRGTQGFFKQSTLSSMTEGIAKGGEPHSTNPITMFKLAYDDSMKFITAQKIIRSLKEDGVIKFVKSGADAPEGYTKISDNVANVYFKSDSGMVKTGEYYIQEGPGRMLNNMLSRDMVRDSKIGQSLMNIKNLYTQVELGLSPFHAVAISLEQIASGAGIGFRKIVNLGDIKGGIKDIISAPFSPKTTFSLGREAFKFSTAKDFENSKEGKKFLKRMPEAAQYVDDFFKGGGLMKQHEELKSNTYKALKENYGKDNYIGAALRALPALNEGVMSPLFNVYIPSLKIGLFMKEFPLILAENKSRLDKGTVTREELSRKVIDSIDNRLGEMNFDNLYWNKTFKTAMQFMLRSVTWKLGNIRQMGGAVPEQAIEFYNAIKEKRRPNLSPKMAWLFGLSLTQVVLSSIIQGMSLDDDDKNKDIKDFKDIVAPRINSADDKERVVIPTYYKDLLHFWHAPTEYVTSGVSGPFGKGIELYKNKDFYGYEIYDETDPAYKKLLDAGKYSVPKPFSISSYQKMKEKGEPVEKQALSFLGFNKAPGYLEHSDLESEIIDLYRIRNASVKPIKMKEANDKKREIRDMYKRDIEKAQEMADEAVNSGLLRPTQVSRLFRDVAKNEDAMVYFFKRLPDSDKQYIYSKMTKEEKAKFDPKNKLGESTEVNVEGTFD